MGILNVGGTVVWKRSGKGKEYHVAVVSGGDLQLPGGTTVSNSSAVSAAAGGISTYAPIPRRAEGTTRGCARCGRFMRSSLAIINVTYNNQIIIRLGQIH